MNPCKCWDKNTVYHQPWYNNTCGVRSNIHLFAGAVDVFGDDNHTVACQACIGGSPWHSEGRRPDIWDQQVGRSRDYWSREIQLQVKTRLELESGDVQIKS